MRSLSALFLLALVTGSWAVQFHDAVPGVQRAVNPRFLLAEIAAKIAAEGPLDDIFKMFDNLEKTIRKEQVEHDMLSAKQEKECKLELSFRKKEVADASSAIDRATQEKNACTTSLHQNRQQLKSNIKTQKDIARNIEILTSTRKDEQAAYDTRHRNYVAAISAVDGAFKILQGLFNGAASLAELSQATTTMFHHGIMNGNAISYVQLIGALAQVSTNSELLIDKNILTRVADLFTILRNKLSEELKSEEATESKSIAKFQGTSAILKDQTKRLKEVETRLRDQISTNEQCIVKANNIITMATTKKERNQNLLNDASKMCKNFEDEYKTATGQRREELQLVDKLREVVGAKFKGISKNVRNRATQTKGEWAKHKNVAVLPKGRRGLGGGKKKGAKLVEVAAAPAAQQ